MTLLGFLNPLGFYNLFHNNVQNKYCFPTVLVYNLNIGIFDFMVSAENNCNYCFYNNNCLYF